MDTIRRGLSLLLTAVMATMAPAAHAYTFGSADSRQATPEQISESATLGSKVSRIVIDVDRPLADYDQAVADRRAAGLRVQFVIGGLAAGRRAPTIQEAVAVYRRWPDAFALSIVNEPELAGWASRPCELRREFGRVYRALKREGAPLVLFGEWSPHSTMTMTQRVLACGPIVADGFAWHAYDWSDVFEGRITNLRAIRTFLARERSRMHTPRGFALPMFVTEYGQKTRGDGQTAEPLAAFRWRRAMALAIRYRVAELVAYGVHEAPSASAWDTSIFDAAGTARQAATAITAALTAVALTRRTITSNSLSEWKRSSLQPSPAYSSPG